jgi:hypothetical protein
MSKNKLILALTIITTLSSSAIFANKIKFPLTDTEGTFYCEVDTITNRFKTVDIHTNGIEVNGFCGGEEYVQTPGHITGMSMSELKKFYFEYKKTLGKEASVDIVATNPRDISCFTGKGKDRRAYGNGKYC